MNRALVMLIGGVAGAATGVVAALLLAPSEGEEVRRSVRHGARNLGVAAQEGLSKGKLRVTELVSSGTEMARQVRDRAGDVGAVLKEQAEKAKAMRPAGKAEPVVGLASETAGQTSDILSQAADALGKVQAALEAIRKTAH